MNEGRILALDLGDARIGLALSDPLGITAQPAGWIDGGTSREVLRRVRGVIEQHDVVEVVVGLPLHLSGRAGSRAEQARDFARRLEETVSTVTVEMWDERLSTAEVERVMVAGNVRRRRRREVVDSLSAVVILQSFLDARAVRESDQSS